MSMGYRGSWYIEKNDGASARIVARIVEFLVKEAGDMKEWV